MKFIYLITKWKEVSTKQECYGSLNTFEALSLVFSRLKFVAYDCENIPKVTNKQNFPSLQKYPFGNSNHFKT